MKYKTIQEIVSCFLSDYEDKTATTEYGIKFVFTALETDTVRIRGIKYDSITIDYVLSKSLIECFQNPKAVLSYIMNDMVNALDLAFSKKIVSDEREENVYNCET